MSTAIVKSWLKKSGMKADDVKVVSGRSVYLTGHAIEEAVNHYRDMPSVESAKRHLSEKAKQHHDEENKVM
ncbi:MULTISPECIES: hypothetical protein [Halomonadaceae]|jgi:hypothetical protein|uniref:hypothetical protein n=1 Tax=Halomonadaceae TaxID=28256 RepID=UPI001582CD51|nr:MULTISPECIES: hypothetical protein [Halomonas]MDI4636199.1 hypothetical protein [Halomonas sp. BMC7]NUJ60563.1 hypothetical protein [Halomonas taeanensis]|tara:strand:+ start:2449 stop:2661 length:213 start_codon:yes stop_codon:yes gene_type:complete